MSDFMHNAVGLVLASLIWQLFLRNLTKKLIRKMK